MFLPNKKLATLLLNCIFSSVLFAQEINIGTKHIIKSEILNEDRELWISLPSSYNDSTYAPASYPVLYLLDPDFYFESMVAVREALTSGLYNYMQEVIIVGINNTDRSRDLTPTNSSLIHSGIEIHKTSGGASDFLAFITEELIPYVDSNYRTTGYRLINGHSFGGLFAFFVLLESPQTFNAYLIHDPSIWWDNKALYKEAVQKWPAINLNGRILYLSMAYNDTTRKDKLEHSQTIHAFYENILSKTPTKGLRYHFEYFKNENHGTIFLPATYNGMRYIYKGMCLPIKQIPNNPELIKEYYNRLSDSLQYTILPTEKIVNEIAEYCTQRKSLQSSLILYQLNINNYPSSAYAHYRLGNMYLKMKNYPDAFEEFEISKKLNPLIILPEIQNKESHNIHKKTMEK